jgi:hypothetical protein
MWFKQNIQKGILAVYIEMSYVNYVKFLLHLILTSIENTSSEKIAQQLELEALEYHTRAMATLQE